MTRQPRKSRTGAVVAGIAVALLFGAAIGVWSTFYRTVPAHHASAEEAFKYGSIGLEGSAGIPYWIWVVLPRVFPEHLPGPGGYASLGFAWEEGAELPVGFAKTTVGVPRVAPNCGFCHTSSYRPAADAPRQVVPGGASATVDAQRYARFLAQAGADPRFTAANLMPEIEQLVRLNAFERWVYRRVLIPRTRRDLRRAGELAAGAPHVVLGPGRVNAFSSLAARRTPAAAGATTATAVRPLWAARGGEGEGEGLFRDPASGALHEALLGFRAEASRGGPEGRRLQELARWLRTLEAPPHPVPVDAPLAATGARVYAAACASCHGVPGAWSDGTAPLSGLWLRAPYLRDGSVPTLWHLLHPAERPVTFYRGYDMYDPEHVGFEWRVSEAAGRTFFLVHTRQPGNDDDAHGYGADLPEAEKKALLEYLKTF